MPYNNNVPLANQRIKDTQQPIHDNFVAIQTLIDVNHEDFASGDQGKHKFVSLTPQSNPPATYMPPSTEINLYNAPSTLIAGTRGLFYRVGVTPGVQINAGVNTQASFRGWAQLPTGALMLWCRVTLISGSVLPTFASLVPGFPGFNGIPYSAVITPFGSANTIYVSAMTKTVITITATAEGMGSLIVIGS